ncbi:MAG: hypothetical protein IJ868_06945 [Prevotella sp.]|nr:hypothetical protein [Prevotella sp.]
MNIDITLILTSALAAVILVVILALVVLLIYYRWRNAELLTGLAKFIRESQRHEREVERLQEELYRRQGSSDSSPQQNKDSFI